MDWYLIVAFIEIQLAENCCAIQHGVQVSHVQKRVLIGGGDQVEQLTQLLHQVEGAAPTAG